MADICKRDFPMQRIKKCEYFYLLARYTSFRRVRNFRRASFQNIFVPPFTLRLKMHRHSARRKIWELLGSSRKFAVSEKSYSSPTSRFIFPANLSLRVINQTMIRREEARRVVETFHAGWRFTFRETRLIDSCRWSAISELCEMTFNRNVREKRAMAKGGRKQRVS